MKKTTQAMKFAHGCFNSKNGMFKSFREYLKAVWHIIRTGNVIFSKENGEVREANIQEFTTIDIKGGYARFIELLPNGTSQFRSLRFERVIFNS